MDHSILNFTQRAFRWTLHGEFRIYFAKQWFDVDIYANKREQLLEGRKTLCDDPNFILLHVQDDGNEMHLVRPADNPIHHDAITEKGFHVLSHVWGNINDYPKWDVSTFITEVDGQPSKPVPMRPEKRNTLLALLKANPGYWWIDVMCARVDTPLVIMGSIYRFCGTCHVMMDCPPDLISDLKKSRMAAFDRALQPLYLDASQHNTYRAFDNMSGSSQWKASKFHKTLIQLHKVINMYQPEFNCMQRLLDSKWFHRLWTLQEVALPTENVRLLSEQCGPDNNVIHFDYNLVDAVSQKIFYGRRHSPREEALHGSSFDYSLVSSSATASLEPETISQVVGGSGAHLLPNKEDGDQYCSKVGVISNDRGPAQDYLKCVLAPGHPLKAVCLRAVLSVFAKSSRKCYMPEDYVYGILGLLSLDIPRMEDPQRVWEIFIEKLEDLLIELSEDEYQGLTYFSVTEKAKTFQLAKAKDMADVYSDLVVMELNNWNVYMFETIEVYRRKKPHKEYPPEYVAGFLKEQWARTEVLDQYRESKTLFYI